MKTTAATMLLLALAAVVAARTAEGLGTKRAGARAHASALRAAAHTAEPAVAATFNASCPLSTLEAPAPGGLVQCAQYADSACCSLEEDKRLHKDFEQVYSSLYGSCPGCLDNMRRMLCGLYCSPAQAKVLTVEERNEDGSIKSAVLRVCPEFCERFYASCQTTAHGSRYHSGQASFCMAQLDSNTGIRIELSHFDCFMDVGPNSCDGSLKEARPPKASNTWLVVTCIALGSVAALVLGLVIYNFNKDEPDDDEFSRQPLMQESEADIEHDAEIVRRSDLDSSEPGGIAEM
eukprot:PLAT1207.1.p2 GENE.PLAT1207.1~~PLAT1207.1.p2  ORF type:complete len:329 (+),score=152.60 PLAT1207.1:116-988(+)